MTYLHPLFPLFLLTALAALIRHWLRLKGKKPRVLAIAMLALFLVSWPPVAWLASATLERGYSAVPLPGGEAEAIVVLARDVDPPRPERPVPIVRYGTYLRCQHAAWLYRHWRPLPVLACAGAVPAFAVAMRQALEEQGVPPSMVWTEQRSKSTYENAVYAAEMLRKKGIRKIALVTEAYHMVRADRCFRKQGLLVVPAPCGFRSTRWGLGVRELLPGPSAISQNEDVLHEWVGLVWYRSLGRI